MFNISFLFKDNTWRKASPDAPDTRIHSIAVTHSRLLDDKSLALLFRSGNNTCRRHHIHRKPRPIEIIDIIRVDTCYGIFILKLFRRPGASTFRCQAFYPSGIGAVLWTPQARNHDGPPRANGSVITEPERKIRARDRQNPIGRKNPLPRDTLGSEPLCHRLRQKRQTISQHVTQHIEQCVDTAVDVMGHING